MGKFEKKKTSLSKLKGVTVHTLQLFCGMQDVSQEEPCSYLLSTTAKQVCRCAWTIYFLIPGASCLNKGQHLLKRCDFFFTASGFARKLFGAVRFRSCCQSVIGADYLISFHLCDCEIARGLHVQYTHSVLCIDLKVVSCVPGACKAVQMVK